MRRLAGTWAGDAIGIYQSALRGAVPDLRVNDVDSSWKTLVAAEMEAAKNLQSINFLRRRVSP